jgi:hypothetical protein
LLILLKVLSLLRGIITIKAAASAAIAVTYCAPRPRDKARMVLTFDKTVRIVHADDTITERLMNVNGGYYDMNVPTNYDEDAEEGSFSFGGSGSVGNGEDEEYLDAVEHEMDLQDGDFARQFLDAEGGYVVGVRVVALL